MNDYTGAQIDAALRRLGSYRVRRAQTVAKEGPPDGISGATILALGLRESDLRNVNGGLKLVDGKWQTDPEKPDHGVFQISTKHHAVALKAMPGVEEGSWWPVIEGATAYDFGHCPRFEESLRYTLELMHEAQAYGTDHGVIELGRFSVAAHNAGIGGAYRGWKEGNVDKYTTGGDYSAWVLRHSRLIREWLHDHLAWRV